jgi:hypothetical protein
MTACRVRRSGCLELDVAQFHGEIDPFLDKLTKALVVLNLKLHGIDGILTDEASVALAFPGVAEVVVRAMLLRGICLALAVGSATDIELLREAAWPEVAQLSQFVVDLSDASFDGGNGR